MRLVALLLLAGCVGSEEFSFVGEPAPQWTDLTAHPCALDDLGDVHCWTSGMDERPWGLAPPPAIVRDVGLGNLVENSYSGVLLLGEDQRYRVVHCEADRVPTCDEGSLPDRYLAISGEWPLGLKTDQTLDYGGPVLPQGPNPTGYFQLLDDATVAGIDGQNRIQMVGFDSPEVLAVEIAGRPKKMTSIHLAPPGGCVLDDTGEVDCVGRFAELPFDVGLWKDLDGWLEAVCGVRDDDVIVCADGAFDEEFTLEWGPIRKLAVRSRSFQRISLCAITERNELRCHGPVFDDAFHEELEAVNEVRRTPEPPELIPWR